MTTPQNFAKNGDPHGASEVTPAPALARATAKLVSTAGLLAPVDTFNNRIVPLEDLPRLSNPSNKETAARIRNLSVSFPLRFLFLALEQQRRRKTAQHELVHITVNLSAKTTSSLLSKRKTPASAYADRIKPRLKQLPEHPDFFFVMEESGDKTLHAHFVMSLPADKQVANEVRQLLMKDTAQRPSDVRMDYQYRNYLNIEINSPEWELHQLDLEMGCSRYSKRHSDGRYYELRPVDLGLADYLSKSLHKHHLLGSEGRRYYAPQHLARTANTLYRSAYELQGSTGL